MIALTLVAFLAIPVSFCLVCVLHLTVLLIAALIGRKTLTASSKADDWAKLAVVIPAHNEEQLVARTIESLQQSEYPQDRREIIVIADNCTDRTAEIARECGATVLERQDEHLRGKGYALRFFIEECLIPEKDIDIVIVVDSDTVVTRNLLLIVSGYVASGAETGQVNHEVGNPDAGWRPAMQYISYALKNHVRALGRDAFGCSAGLFGNGMFFTRALLVKEGWPASSIVEDTEFGLYLALKGIKVQYAPEAVARALMPTSDSAGKTQKARWEFGQIRMARSFIPRLARGFLRKPSANTLFWLLDLVTPPLVPFFAITVFLFLMSCGAWIFIENNLAFMVLLASGLSGILLGVYAIGGLLLSRAPWCVWRSLAALPLYVLWKMKVYCRLVFEGGPKEWIRTDRR